jgi:hypothetical protein
MFENQQLTKSCCASDGGTNFLVDKIDGQIITGAR